MMASSLDSQHLRADDCIRHVGKDESSRLFDEAEDRECAIRCAMFDVLPKGC